MRRIRRVDETKEILVNVPKRFLISDGGDRFVFFEVLLKIAKERGVTEYKDEMKMRYNLNSGKYASKVFYGLPAVNMTNTNTTQNSSVLLTLIEE